MAVYADSNGAWADGDTPPKFQGYAFGAKPVSRTARW
jgi:hypothetical protein